MWPQGVNTQQMSEIRTGLGLACGGEEGEAGTGQGDASEGNNKELLG